MKINLKLISKYGSQDEVLLPPALEEGEEESLPEIPVDKGAPVILDPSEEESAKFFNIRFDPEESRSRREYVEKLQRIQENNMYQSPEENRGDMSTRPGGKKSDFPTYTSTASKHDLLLSACDTYCQLATKK